MELNIDKYPRIVIQYCSKCKWHNRANWYLNEIFQTFSDQVEDVSLQPISTLPGIFQIILVTTKDSRPEILYKRRFKKTEEPQNEPYYYDGFPDSQFLKLLIKEKLTPEANLGHIEKTNNTYFLTKETNEVKIQKNEKEKDCEDCRKQE